MFEGLSKADIYQIVNNTVQEENIFLYVFKHNTIADTFNSNIARSREDVLESVSEGLLIFTKNYVILKQFKYSKDGELMEKDTVMGYNEMLDFKVKKYISKVVISWQYNGEKFSYEIDIKNPGAYDFNVENYLKLKEKNFRI